MMSMKELPEIPAPPKEESLGQKTIGQLMFEEPPTYIGFYDPGTKGQQYSPYRQIRDVNSVQEIVKEIHALKLLDMTKPAILTSTAWALENVFKSLAYSKKFVEALAQQATENAGSLCSPRANGHIRFKNGVDKTAPEFIALVRQWREYIGNIALDVFFEKVFEKDKDILWRHFSNIPYGFKWIPRGPNFESEPHSLLVFLRYFAMCSSETKKGFQGKIRKFLEYALTQPLTPPLPSPQTHTTTVGFQPANVSVPHTKITRKALACALVANGMYEECLEYNLSEAYLYLVTKFLGCGLIETEDGLIQIYVPGQKPSPEDAMAKALENKEWAHIWSVITRMAYKMQLAKFVRITDPDDLRVVNGSTTAPLKLALRFENTLNHGMLGF